MKKYQIAVLGYGGMGTWHIHQLKKMPAFSIRGIMDIDVERNKQAIKENLFCYSSFESMLQDDQLDVVTIVTPNHLHKQQAIACLQAGKHVVCEKPVTLSYDDLQEILVYAKKYNRFFTVHQNRRWDEDFLVVKKLLTQQTLGPVFCIESRVHGSRGIPGDWRNQKEFGGGMVLDWGVHLLDQALLLTDAAVTSIYASLTYVTNEQVEDGFKILLTFENGLNCHLEVGTSHFYQMPRWYLLGENGSAVIRNWHLDGEIVMVSDWTKRDAVPVVTAAGLTKTMAPRTDETIQTFPLPVVTSDIGDFYRHVCQVLEGTQQSLITIPQISRVMQLIDLVFESAKINQVVHKRI